MLFGDIYAFHTGRNRNGSNVPHNAAKKAMKTMAYKPLLANFCEVEKDGEIVRDFTSHDIEINDDKSITYIERQIGCFTADAPYFKKYKDKEYICAKVAIPREYTDAADIIERKNGTKVSVELIINEMSFDAKKKELILSDIEVQGCTCLGTNPQTGEEVQEGMEGSRLDISDFSYEADEPDEELNRIIQEVAQISEWLDNLKDTQRKEEFSMDENLETTVFEDEGAVMENPELTNDEGAEGAESNTDISEETTDATANGDAQDDVVEPTEDTDADTEDTEDVASEDDGETEDNNETDSFEEEPQLKPTFCRTYELSQNQITSALYALIEPMAAADGDWYSIIDIYETYAIYVSWNTGEYHGIKYDRDGDEVKLSGEPYALYLEYLTDTERAKLQDMRSNYEAMAAKLAKYEDEPKKMEILSSAEYASIADKAEFIALCDQANHFDLTVDEVVAKADSIQLMYAKKGELNAPKNETGMFTKVTLVTSKPMGRYGNIFKKSK